MGKNEDKFDLLIDALAGLPFYGTEDMPDEREGMVICIVLMARANDNVDEVIDFVESHKARGEDFSYITQALVNSDMFPLNSVEYTDDDELDE